MKAEEEDQGKRAILRLWVMWAEDKVEVYIPSTRPIFPVLALNSVMLGTIRLFGFYRCFAAIFSFFARFLEVLLKMRAQISSQLRILAALQKTDPLHLQKLEAEL